MTVTYPEFFVDFTHRLKSEFALDCECPDLYWDATVFLTAETSLQFMVLDSEIDAFIVWSKAMFGRGTTTLITTPEVER